ncbi:MAG: DNA-3-methyladenine glycosylase 2 family protein [Pseudomonadota bacterium]
MTPLPASRLVDAMPSARRPTPIRTKRDLAASLAALAKADPRLCRAAALAAPLPLRLHPPGLAGLLRIVTGQQLSKESAAAVWTRVESAFDPMCPVRLSTASEETLRAPGLSRQKVRTFRSVAEAVAGGLDLEGLASLPAEEARPVLEAIPGIGPWSADLYLMFCAGHPDILPVGDLAVRRGAGRVLGLPEEPTPDALSDMGHAWAPWRSTASRLFWAVYRFPADTPLTAQPVS